MSAQNARDWTYSFQNFGLNEGLPSTEVYHVMQDQNKNLWFSTDRGVVKYDGHKFHSYNKSHGLPDLTIFKSYQDEDGKIWFSSFSHELSYFFEDSIYQYSRNKELTELWNKLGSQHTPPHDFFLQGDSIYMGIQKNRMIVIPPKDSMYNVSVQGKTDNVCYLFLAENRKSYSCYRWFAPNYGKFYFQDSLYQFEDRNASIRRIAVDYHKGLKTGILSVGSQLFQMVDRDFNEIETFKGQIDHTSLVTDILIDSKDAVWVSTLNNGVLFYPSIQEMHKIPVKFLDGHTISAVLEDHEGGYWFSSTDNGVYYMAQPSLKTLKTELTGSRINEIISFKKKVLLACQNGSITKIDNNQISNLWTEYLYQAPIYTLFNYKNEHLLISSDAIYRPYKKGLLYNSVDKRGAIKSTAVNSKGETFIATSSTISVLKPGFHFDQDNYYTALFKARASKLVFDEGDTLWLGTRSGLLYSVSPYTKAENYVENAGDVRDVELKGDYLAYVTKEGGVHLETKGKFKKLTNVPNNYLNCLSFEGDSFLWVGGSKGLFSYSLKRPEEILMLNQFSGLVNNDVKSLSNIRDTLWIGTANGLNFIPLKELNVKTRTPDLKIESILVNNKPTLNRELRYNENNVTIRLKGINYREKQQQVYQYRLSDENSVWNDVYEQKLILPGLKPDQYEIQFRVINEVNQTTSDIQHAKFVILPPFWKTLWFLFLVIIASIGVVVWFFSQRIKRLREKNLLQKEAFENEKKALVESQKALRAQMNPHFLFNSLNSVYHLIIKDDLAGAKKTITKISKLMRGLLEGSREELINLEDEVTLLTDYLNLQKLQFENDFDFKISVDDELEEDDYQIHSMLIQPFIENAIIHGLLPLRSRAAFISVDFNMLEGTKVKVTVTDNGIGRKASEVLKKDKKHKSLAMTVTQERLAHLSSYDKEYYFRIKDLDEGTVVELIIPLA
jgi:ligand-binding sensor domain-containing protein/two-component sensor histidine kinase